MYPSGNSFWILNVNCDWQALFLTQSKITSALKYREFVHQQLGQ